MLPCLTIALIAAAAVAIARLPSSLWRAYRGSFAERHGVNFQVSAALLATLASAMLVATLALSERRPVVEITNALVVALGIVAGALDLYLFARRRVKR
jgi:hypothetical protein